MNNKITFKLKIMQISLHNKEEDVGIELEIITINKIIKMIISKMEVGVMEEGINKEIFNKIAKITIRDNLAIMIKTNYKTIKHLDYKKTMIKKKMVVV